MVGLVEIVLFLLPFVLFAAWRVLAPYASRLTLVLALLGVALVAVSAAWYGRGAHMGWREGYVPAVTLPDGRIVPGHAAGK